MFLCHGIVQTSSDLPVLLDQNVGFHPTVYCKVKIPRNGIEKGTTRECRRAKVIKIFEIMIFCSNVAFPEPGRICPSYWSGRPYGEACQPRRSRGLCLSWFLPIGWKVNFRFQPQIVERTCLCCPLSLFAWTKPKLHGFLPFCLRFVLSKRLILTKFHTKSFGKVFVRETVAVAPDGEPNGITKKLKPWP